MKMTKTEMLVTKRNGKQETVKLDKVLARIEKQCYGLNLSYVNPFDVAKKVIDGIYNGVTTKELDILAAETAAALTTKHPDYSVLAGRIVVSSLQKNTLKSFSKATELLYSNINVETGEAAPLVSKEYYDVVMANAQELNSAIIHSRDFNYDYFGFKTLEKSYLLKVFNNTTKKLEIAETPQFLIMRVAIGIHGSDIEQVLKTYELMSNNFFTHATPTLFNAGSTRPQLASCFLMQMKDDSIEGIFDTVKQTALISKNAGGIGISMSNIRSAGSYIKGTNGTSNGVVPMLKTFNEVAKYVDQGGGKRKGSISFYIEPWHADIEDFLELKKNSGKEELKARDLFYAVWMPDLFMQRVEKDEMWSLMCPSESKGLQDVYGEDFVNLYTQYEQEGKYKRQVKARDLWMRILDAQIETGTPYILYKDSCNIKSNQKNIGVIKNSNLCLAGGTNIKANINGIEKDIKLEELIDIYDGKTEIKVLSYNTDTKVSEWKKVTNAAMTNPFSEVIKITDDATGKYIICTEEHQIWTENRGYVKAIELNENDVLNITENVIQTLELETI